ncbi:MAG: energy transducer TonB [Sulfuriferula sp.]|nr:energy transducer TonB [Sulfuriferula sp.]
MPRSLAIQEPELSPAARRVLAALLFSLGVHGAIIGLVQIAPTSKVSVQKQQVMQVQFSPAATSSPAQAVDAQAIAVPIMHALAQSSTSVPLMDAVPSVTATTVTPAVVAATADNATADTIATNKTNLPQLDLPLSVDSTYYTAKEVDVHPRALNNIQPVYPEAAASSNQQGWVILRIKLDEMGRVESVKVADATPAGVFDESALTAFKQGRFAPAQKSGRAVKSLVEIKVWFKLE